MSKKDESLIKTGDTSIIPHTYGSHAGKGYEGQGKDDYVIPMVKILQGLSPEVTRGLGRPGELYNTVTGQTWAGDRGVLYVPALTSHVFGKWTPRDAGGGFHGNVAIDDPVVLQAKKDSLEFGKYMTPDGLQLRECFYVFGAICDDDGNPESPAVIPFAGTKIKSYKGWNTRMKFAIIKDADGQRILPPLYAHIIRVKSTMTKNTKGEFFVPVIESADRRGITQSLLGEGDPRFQMGAQVYEQVRSGDAKVNYEAEGDEGSESGGAAAPF